MATSGNTSTAPAPGFWKIRHAVIGLGVLAVLVVLMMRACGDDDVEDQVSDDEAKPRQAIVVQIPASQWPQAQQQARQALPQQPAPMPQRYEYQAQQQQSAYGQVPRPQQQQSAYGQVAQPQQQQPAYGYVPQTITPPPPAAATGNPWAVQQQPYSYGSGVQAQQWGRQEPANRPQYVQPPAQSQYRPLEQPAAPAPAPAPAQTQQQVAPVTGYWPSAPYDRLSGSSFGVPVYPQGYTGGYPGYYGVPGGAYAPGWPMGYPGVGYPGFW